jgi:hypothetical protein
MFTIKALICKIDLNQLYLSFKLVGFPSDEYLKRVKPENLSNVEIMVGKKPERVDFKEYFGQIINSSNPSCN